MCNFMLPKFLLPQQLLNAVTLLSALQCYTTWLSRLVDALLPEVDGKDKSLASFLADLPRIPDDVTRKVSQLCLDKEDKERYAFVHHE